MKTGTNNNQNENRADSIRVLIVDDIAQVRHGLATLLALSTRNQLPGIQVIGEAENGFEAIAKSASEQPDVVLMDLEMPGLDGLAATRKIKSVDPTIGIVVLSIHSDEGSRMQANQAGADAFIEKGAPISELLQAIRRFGGGTCTKTIL